MLKLRNIEISGFKSFVDPIDTEFSDGITAIVGPNGCGKSNLSEAITWVLGEQSAKSLRGGKMEDVIFSGTDRRKPLGMAEVSLTLETDQDIRGAVDGKLIIGRRIFRSGESQYRLNDNVVRLKEIKDILADTGLGVRAYSVIEQGRIGQILSSKPTERRKLIEEAAGVTRYKNRKRLAELKLEDATANRMRLDDIISEVERALRSLKRQSNAARRFKEREGEHRELLHRVLAARYAALHRELSELERQLSQSSDHDAALGAELSSLEADLAAARQQLDELTRDIAKRHQRTAELGARIEGRQEFIRGTRATIEQVAERVENGIRIAEQRQRQMQEHLDAISSMDERKDQLAQDRQQALSLVEDGTGRLERADAALSEVKVREATLRQDLLDSAGQVSAVQQRQQRKQMDQEKAQFRKERALKALEDKAAEIKDAKRVLQQANEQAQALESEHAEYTASHEQAKVKLEEIVAEESTCNERCEGLRLEQAQLEQRQAILEEFAREDTERREGLREAIEAIGLHFSDEESVGGNRAAFLEDLIQGDALPADHEAAVDAFLESMRDAVVVPHDEDALQIASELSARGFDAVLLRPSHADDATDAEGAPLDPFAGLRARVAAKKRTVTETRRVPVERVVERTVEETVEVPHEVEVEVEVEVPVAQPAAEAASVKKRGWLDVLLSPFRRAAPDSPASGQAGTEVHTEVRRETRTEIRTEMRTETRPRVVRETVTEFEDREVEVEIEDAPEAGESFAKGIRCTLGDALGLHADLSRALPPALLVDDSTTAATFGAQHPHVTFLAPDGLLVRSGSVQVRSAGAAPGAVGRSAEALQVAERLPLLGSELSGAAEHLDALVANRTEQASELNRLASALNEKKQELAVATARRQDQQHRVEHLEAEQRGIAEEQGEIEELLGTIDTATRALASEFETVQAAHGELEQRFETLQEDVGKARDHRQTVKTEGEGRKSELRLLEERVEAHAAETNRLHRLSEEVSEFLTRWSEQRSELGTRQEQLNGEVETARVDLQRALEDREEAEQAKVAVQQALDQQRAKVRSLEEGVTAKRDERDQARSQIQELRVGEAQQKQQALNIAETYEKEFSETLSIDALLARHAERAREELEQRQAGEPSDEPTTDGSEAEEGAADVEPVPETTLEDLIPPNLPELMADLDNLKQIMDRMGPVNVLAAEEYKEQEERHLFLTEQRADVQSSIESLRKTIKEINETSIERFMQAFVEVNQFFGEAFEKLFRGGEASMRLLDDEEPLESGIEIVARPPGKRLQNIQLLSGGEKALTAIALLFALFRHKPSPFCILDEVDAPLDDANCVRFIEMLNEMAKETQLLVVTHNKLTMEAANVLYGVTMAEKGVSKLVGVNIDELHPAELLAS